MANNQTEEQWCRDGTADLAEALLDSLSTGVKISVMFVVVVVFSFLLVMSQMAQGAQASAALQVSAAPVVTGSPRVPGHPAHPVSSSQGTEVVVSSVHSGEVPVGEVAVPSSSIPTSGVQVTLERFQPVVLQFQFQVVQVLVLEVQLVEI